MEKPSPEDTCLHQLTGGQGRVGVMGLGYVGLPLALALARHTSCLGYDVDGAVVAPLLRGQSHLPHIPSAKVAAVRDSGRLQPTTESNRLSSCDAVVVCVPTPLGPHKEPDLSAVTAAADALGPRLRRGMLVCLESTSWPGTTEEVFIPRLQRHTKLRAGADYMVAYSPEREDPGNAAHPAHTVPKVVGAIDAQSLRCATALYRLAFDRVVTVSGCQVAEATKLLENVFRCVNIALVNEMKMLCHAMGIDVWEVIHAASSKPFGFMPFYPGPGLGGHCIPVDPFYLAWRARAFDRPARFVELAGEVNTAMPRWVMRRVVDALNGANRPVMGANVLMLGVAYKRGIADTRESPALTLMRLCHRQGANVSYHDPHVPRLDLPWAGGAVGSTPLTADVLQAADVVVVTTDHAGVDYGLVGDVARLVVDTRHVMPAHCRATVVQA